MSYQINVDPKRLTGARLISKATKGLRRAFLKKQRTEKLTQQEIARRLSVERATINRRLLGNENMTLRTLAEMAWAIGHDVDIRFVDLRDVKVSNGWQESDFFRYSTKIPAPTSAEHSITIHKSSAPGGQKLTLTVAPS